MIPQMVLDKFSSLHNSRNPACIFFMLLVLFATMGYCERNDP